MWYNNWRTNRKGINYNKQSKEQGGYIMLYKENTWVRIHQITTRADNEAETWLKGYLVTPGKIGDLVKVKTMDGREEKGKLIEAYPEYFPGKGATFSDPESETIEYNNKNRRL